MSADRPHAKDVVKDLSKTGSSGAKVPSGGSSTTGRTSRKASDKQLSLPFDELEVPTLESARQKLSASKASAQKAIPGISHSAKTIFRGPGESSLTEGKGRTITPYVPEGRIPRSQDAKDTKDAKASKANKASGGSLKVQGPPKRLPASTGQAERTERTGRTDRSTESLDAFAVTNPQERKPTSRTSSSRSPSSNANASKEFEKDAEVYAESAEAIDFRSSSSRNSSHPQDAKRDGRRRQDPGRDPLLSREEMLNSVKNQVASTRNKAVEPDVSLHAGPNPTVEDKKRVRTASTSKKASARTVPQTSRTKGMSSSKMSGQRGYRSRAKAQPRTSRIGTMIMVVALLAMALLVALVVVFVHTGKAAEKRVPSVMEGTLNPVGAGGAGKTGAMAVGNGPAVSDSTVLVEIRAGMTARQVCQLLESSGVVADSQQVLDYLVANDLAGSIRQGSFLLRTSMDIEACVSMITNAVSAVADVTVFPGYTIQEIDRLLSTRGYAEAGDFIEATQALAQGYGLSFAEGWFLSGTYQVPRVNGAQTLAVSMFQAMLDTLRPLLGDIAALDRSVDEVLIVASMIQRETNNASEMPLIAGIIYKRLDEGIALGIDATTRYETGNWTDPINPIDLETLTPYNTRRKKGLPPSGIGCTGIDALLAAVYPEESDWYYYLHGTDGKIHFARTYEEHTQNISIWR